MNTFRLIESGFCNAATNMAVDEALFLSYQEHVSIPVLRLYGWDPAAISIGYSQNPNHILDLDVLKEKNIPWVRRPTGGGVIFHDQELTYSVIGASSDFSANSSIRDSFEKITGFLIEAYHSLGVQASFSKKKAVAPHAIADLCFARKEEYDILVNNKKLGGNAQRRKNNIILQHGSIPLTFDRTKLKSFLKKPEALDTMDIITLSELKKGKTTFHQLAELLIKAFSIHFSRRIIQSNLTPQESALARDLKIKKYENNEWTILRHDHRTQA